MHFSARCSPPPTYLWSCPAPVFYTKLAQGFNWKFRSLLEWSSMESLKSNIGSTYRPHMQRRDTSPTRHVFPLESYQRPGEFN